VTASSRSQRRIFFNVGANALGLTPSIVQVQRVVWARDGASTTRTATLSDFYALSVAQPSCSGPPLFEVLG